MVASATGTFNATITIPSNTPGGSHTITVSDTTGKTATAAFNVLVSGTITLSPTSGTAGTSVTVSGSNFSPNSAITIRLGTTTLSTAPSTVTTTSTGTFSVTVQIPIATTAGTHTITATDAAGRVGSTTFTVAAGQTSITLSPSSGTVGSAVTVTGSGFIPNRGITINLDGNLVATATSSQTGTFSAIFNIPQTASSGARTVTASDGDNTASATLSVIGRASDIINVSQTKLVDQMGSTISRPSVGMQVLIQSDVRNTLSTDQPFAYIVQIKDSNGATVMIAWMTGVLPPAKQFAVAQSWLAERNGTYTAEVFVWESISNPVVLAPMQRINLNVQ